MGIDPDFAPETQPGRPAIFLDRDGTLIEDVDYLSDPKDIRIIPGVVEGLARLEQAGFARVIVTNQSGVGRGMITLAQLDRIHDEMSRLFSEQGVTFDAIYSCPEVPIGNSEAEVEHEDRKPGPGMLKQAARDLGLNLVASWMIGDKLSDVLAGYNAGCRSIRLRTGKGRSISSGARAPGLAEHTIVDDLLAAVNLILASDPFSSDGSDDTGGAIPTR